MHQRDTVRAAWAAARLYETRDAKLREFLKYFDDSPMDCWPEMVEKARSNYAAYIERLVQPLWQTGDKLLRVNLVRFADLSLEVESKLITKLVAKCDPDTDRPEIAAAVNAADKNLLEKLVKRKNFPADLGLLANRRLARLNP